MTYRTSAAKWIATEVVGTLALIAICALLDTKYYGSLALIIAIGGAIAAIVIGLRAQR